MDQYENVNIEIGKKASPIFSFFLSSFSKNDVVINFVSYVPFHGLEIIY
jgi:hypothetical protein